jgi:uncharacterized phage infection (PIP) family protein YhgE
MIGQFFRILCWSVFAGWLLAVIGLAVPKIWHLNILDDAAAQSTWGWSWIGGGLLLGMLVAAGMTWIGRESRLNAAIEVDRRFGLKERISSALVLDEKTAESEAGRALVKDAVARAQAIDVRDKFGYQPTWRAALPVIPAVILATLLLVPNAALDKQADASELNKIDTERVKVAVEQARKKFAEKAREMETKGLKDALAKLDSLDKKIDDLVKGNPDDKKESLVKLNDVKKQIEERQKELGGADELKESLKKLNTVSKGPAKQIAEAMKSGDLDEAKKAIKELAEKLKSGKLSETEKQQLAKDLKELAKQLQQMVEEQQQAKEKLKEQIKQAQQQGDLDKAAELQQQLDKMEQQQQKMQQKMQQMAENLQKCADCMNQQKQGGKPGGQQPGQQGNQQGQAQLQKAGEALEDLADEIEQMQQDMQDLDNLEDLAKSLEDIKNAMNDCECEGMGDKPGAGDWQKGSGKGFGKREKGEGDTSGFKSQVKGKLQKGETVVTGSADGNNITGKSVSEAREIVKASMNDENDPLGEKKLPKSTREHAREYFQKVRDGN